MVIINRSDCLILVSPRIASGSLTHPLPWVGHITVHCNDDTQVCRIVYYVYSYTLVQLYVHILVVVLCMFLYFGAGDTCANKRGHGITVILRG